MHRVVSEAEAAAGPSRFGGDHFDVEQALEDLGRRELLVERPVELSTQMLGGSGHAQIGEVFTKTLIAGRLGDAHETTS
jgi:hypothetical protein